MKSQLSNMKFLDGSPLPIWLKFILWVFVLVLGLVFIWGRYEWAEQRDLAWVGYICSAFFFVTFTPTFYYLFKTLSASRALALVVTSLWWITATVPYYWVGLDKFYYPFEENLSIQSVVTKPDWFPGFTIPAIPQESFIFGGLALLSVGLAVYLYIIRPQHRRLTFLGSFVFLVILFETWLHLSHRSPYTYIVHYDQEPEKNYWFLMYLFSNGKGAVNLDVSVFRAVEYIFWGQPAWNNMLIRRSFYHYISSQYSYFFNMYYVGLIINIILWFLSVIAGWLFVKKLWNERVAMVAAWLIATGPGFIMFVAQPKSYVAGYASIILLIYLFEKLVVENGKHFQSFILFGAALGLASLTYDMFPFYFFLLGYGLFRHVQLRRLMIVFIVSLGMYFGFLYLYTGLLSQEIVTTNSQLGTDSVSGILAFLKSRDLSLWYSVTREFWAQFFLNLGNAFFVFPVVLALIGLMFWRDYSQSPFVIFILILPAIILQALLQYGNSWIYALPRLIYIAYPAIYVLVGIFVDQITCRFAKGRGKYVTYLFPVLFMTGFFVLSNVDILGFPTFYYHFYWSSGPQWLRTFGN